MSNLSKKFVVFHIRPPYSSKPSLVDGTSYRHTLLLYLILEMVMTCVRCPGAFDERIVRSRSIRACRASCSCLAVFRVSSCEMSA